WFYLFEENERAIDPSDSEIDKQIAYGKQMLDMQEEIKNDLKADGKEKSYSAGIKEYIIYKEEIDQLTKLYAKYAEKLNDRDLRKDYFLETVHEDVIKDNADKKEEELIGEMAEKWLTEGNDQFGAYMLTKAKMEACTSAMSKNEGEIKNWLSGAANNERFFLRYAHQYNEEAYSTLFILGMSLETMKEGLNTLNTSLGDILTKMEDIEKKKKAWKKSIDGVNSDSTKAAMLNDYNTAIDKLDKKEIEALKKIVTEELQPQVEKQLAMVKSVKYLGQQLYKVESAKKVMQQETNMRIEKKIEDKIKNKLLQGVLKDVGAKANEAIWKKIDADEKMPIFPDFSKNDTILNTPFDLKDDNSLKTAAQNLVKEHYDSSGFVIKDFKRFRVLDGINDKKDFSAYDAEDMEAQDVIGKKENAKNGGSSDLLDQDEAFVITLYAEYKASQKAAKDNGGGGEGEGEVPKNADQAKLENSANKGRDDATNGEQPAVTQAGGQQQTVTTVTTVTEDFGSIMSGIKGYCKDNEEPTQETTPNCPNSSINNKKPADSSGGDGLKNAKAMLDKLADIGTVIVQNVYLEEYLTEMFTCRTDNQQLNKLTANPDKKVLPVVLLNGYTNENARKAYNNNANSGARTGRYINENTAWYGREIEYLLFGNTDLNANMLATDGTIFAIRFALNAIYAFTAPDIQAFALQIATAIAGWTVIGVPIVQACITILIALAESGYDIYLLHDGQNVAIYKNAATFVCSPSGFLKEVTEKAAETFINTVVDKVADKVEEELDKVVNDITQEVTDLSKKTVSDCADNLSDSVNKYAEQQKASLKTAVANMFVTPILNNIVPVESLIDAGDRYKTAVPSDLIEDAVRKAIEQVESTVSGMGDSAAKRVAKKLLDKSKEPMITNITAKLCSYFGVSGSEGAALPQGTGNQSLDELMTEMFIGKTGVVGLIDNVKDELDDEIKKVKDTINDNIDKYGDMAATNVKDFMHEQFASASEQISGSLKNAASNLTDKLPTGQSGNLDTSATSGGFSLNYKEYCKILMMIFICTSENQILQRAGVLVTANMRNPYPKNPNVNEAYMGTAKNFDLTKANTLFSVTAQVEMKTLFPWGVQVNQGEGNEDEGLKLDLSELGNNSIKINYCGINGY
ncbi:MAG: DUF5702 domain-containing protein, partial [Oscillospiraceae bacterium]|nr:DUF5702 domain-containing protein [Oscillospiraceae bacterium]